MAVHRRGQALNAIHQPEGQAVQLSLSFPEYATLVGIGKAHPAVTKLLATAELAVGRRTRRWTVQGERAEFLEAQLDLLVAAKLISRPRIARVIRSVVRAIDDLIAEKRKVLQIYPDQPPPDNDQS